MVMCVPRKWVSACPGERGTRGGWVISGEGTEKGNAKTLPSFQGGLPQPTCRHVFWTVNPRPIVRPSVCSRCGVSLPPKPKRDVGHKSHQRTLRLFRWIR